LGSPFRLGSLAFTPIPKPIQIQQNQTEFTERKLHPHIAIYVSKMLDESERDYNSLG